MNPRDIARILEGEAFFNSQRFRERAEHYQQLGQWLERTADPARTLPENWWSYPPPKALLEQLHGPERPTRSEEASPPAKDPTSAAPPASWALGKGGQWLVRAQPGLPEGSEITVVRSNGRETPVILGAALRQESGRTLYAFQPLEKEQATDRPEGVAAVQSAATPAAESSAAAPSRAASAPSTPRAARPDLERIVSDAEQMTGGADGWTQKVKADVAALSPKERRELRELAEQRRNAAAEGIRDGQDSRQVRELSARTTRLEYVSELAAARTRSRSRGAAAEMER